MLLETADGKILLTGDMELLEEAELLATDADLACDVLKVANHGDGDATSAELIYRAGARVAVISTDPAEKPGTPDERVVQQLVASGAQVLVTADSDAVRCTLEGGNVSAEHVFWENVPEYQGVSLRLDREDERFTLANGSDADISLKKWYIYSDAGNELFVFGDVTLPAGGQVTVGTKSSEGEYDVYWDEKNVISNKKEDAISLYDENGRYIGGA